MIITRSSKQTRRKNPQIALIYTSTFLPQLLHSLNQAPFCIPRLRTIKEKFKLTIFTRGTDLPQKPMRQRIQIRRHGEKDLLRILKRCRQRYSGWIGRLGEVVCGDDKGWGDVSCVFCSRWEIFGGVEGFVRHQVGFAEAAISSAILRGSNASNRWPNVLPRIPWASSPSWYHQDRHTTGTDITKNITLLHYKSTCRPNINSQIS